MSDVQSVRPGAECFYWAMLDGTGWSKPGPLPRGLLPALADEVPIPAEDLVAVCASCGGSELLVCAVERQILGGIDPGVLSFAPAALPGFIDGPLDPETLEFLVGEFEPRPLRRARALRHAVGMFAVLACAALVSVGFGRRAAVWTLSAAAAERRTANLVQSVLPGGSADSLTLEVMWLGERSTPPELRRPADASVCLASLLNSWPAQAPSKPQGLNIAPTHASVSTVIEGDPSAFLRSLHPPPGWRMDEPRLNATGQSTRVTLSFRPEGKEP